MELRGPFVLEIHVLYSRRHGIPITSPGIDRGSLRARDMQSKPAVRRLSSVLVDGTVLKNRPSVRIRTCERPVAVQSKSWGSGYW